MVQNSIVFLLENIAVESLKNWTDAHFEKLARIRRFRGVRRSSRQRTRMPATEASFETSLRGWREYYSKLTFLD
jgi:hypothetical protein